MNAAASYHQPRPPWASTTSRVGEVADHGQQVLRVGELVHRAGERAACRSARPAARRARRAPGTPGTAPGRRSRNPPCTGCSLSAAAPRSSWRRTSSAIGKCRCGLTLATGRNRRGLCSTIGSRSSNRWYAGRLGAVLAEQQRGVDALLREELVERGRVGPAVGVPDVARGCRPGRSPGPTATQAGLSDPSTGTCTWASTSRCPSSIRSVCRPGGDQLGVGAEVTHLAAPPGMPSGSSRPGSTS